MNAARIYLAIALVFCQVWSFAQKDTLRRFVPEDSLSRLASPVAKPRRVDSVLESNGPRKAAIRSAIIPGWGQAYNKKYWKIPIVYGALGTSAGIFFYNLKYYKQFRFAYTARVAATPTSPTQMADSSGYKATPANLQAPFFDLASLKVYRDDFRRNIDYSVLAFILLWGLNVVDATVDAHLKTFDVSPDLSLKFHIGHSEMANTNGISVILALK
jgi:Family of unknown function (DUF5683)